MDGDRIVEAARSWLELDAEGRATQGPIGVAVCAEAIRTLAGRLRELGYPADPMLVAAPAADAAVAEFAAEGHQVPPALAEVWRNVGAVELVDFTTYAHMAWWEALVGPEARVHACDGLVVEAPDDDGGWIGYVLDTFDEQTDAGLSIAYPLGPDHLHKDDTSGGDPYELVPDEADPWMARLRGFDWVGPRRPASALEGSTPDLVSYLRTAVLECGGFPGLHGIDAFEPVRRRLVDDLPIF